MNNQHFTTNILVNQSPAEVFNAICNVRGWWSEEITGNTARTNDEFVLQYQDVHRCRIRLTEVTPGKKIVWQVLENYFSFTKDSSEWTGNTITFDITGKDGKTQLQFKQTGLVPQNECYDICSNAWTNYIRNSLYKLITIGKGEPNAAGRPQTENEKRLTSTNQ